MKRFRGGLIFKAHRLLYHSTLGLRVMKKKKKAVTHDAEGGARAERASAQGPVRGISIGQRERLGEGSWAQELESGVGRMVQEQV